MLCSAEVLRLVFVLDHLFDCGEPQRPGVDPWAACWASERRTFLLLFPLRTQNFIIHLTFYLLFPTVWTWDVGLRAADRVCCSLAIHSKVLFLKTSFMQNKVAGTRLWNNYDVLLLCLECRKIWMCPPPRWLEPMGTAHRYCASWMLWCCDISF